MSIEFIRVDKSLRRKQQRTLIFRDTSIRFEPDRITGVLAAPMSGKTAAVHLAIGATMPDKGSVKRDGLISFPVGNSQVFSNVLTGRQNIAFLCHLYGFDPRPITKFVIDFADLGRDIDKPMRRLSRDQNMRLVFATTYAIPFEIYVSDGVLVGGRGEFRKLCEDLVAERMKSSGFLIFTSMPAILRKYCNDFAVIDDYAMHRVNDADEADQIIGKERLKEGDGAVEELLLESPDSE